MTAYRFCRTDDIGLLVDSLNRCWAPYFPDEPLMTAPEFKRSIRDLQVWCSSCMVAFAGPDPIGVLIGAKRPSATLVHRIAVHPDHRRQGHGRHLLDSLGSKLAILGPPRIVAEVPDAFEAACGLFSAARYVEEAILTDYVLSEAGPAPSASNPSGFVIPVTVDDLAANGLLEPPSPPVSPPGCWERAPETLAARKGEIAGLAVDSEERIEAYALYIKEGTAGPGPPAFARAGAPMTDLVALRSFVEDGGARLKLLLSRLGTRSFRFLKVHPAEVPAGGLEALGFLPAGGHLLYAATPRQGSGSPRARSKGAGAIRPGLGVDARAGRITGAIR